MAKIGIHRLFRSLTKRPSRAIAVRRRRNAARWVAAIAYAFLALGIPLPVPAGRISGEPFPCMNHHCGCQSAEQCWQNCCCMTLEERLVWARQNHVRPPDYALAAARAAGIQWAANWPSDDKWQDSAKMACEEQCHAHDSCNETSHQCPCCKPKTTCSCCNHGESPSSTAECSQQHSKSVILLEAMKCHGASENWQGLSISLPPPIADQIDFLHGPVETVHSVPAQFSSISSAPDVPPPRVLVRG
jgi:hypothetical protein